jgi:hypothetical protein
MSLRQADCIGLQITEEEISLFDFPEAQHTHAFNIFSLSGEGTSDVPTAFFFWKYICSCSTFAAGD